MAKEKIFVYPWTDAYGDSALHRQGTMPITFAACVAFALMFYAGDVKGNANLAGLSFDLTVGTSALALALSFFSFLARRGKVRIQAMWMYALFFAISTTMVWTEYTPYAIDKIMRMFTFSLMAAMLPAFIFAGLQEVRIFISSIIVSGMLISAAGLMQVVNGEYVNGRLTGINSNTISLGRNSGIALVGLYTLVSSSGRSKIWLAVFCLPLFLVVLSSGSRGPALFALCVIAFVTVRWSLQSVRSALTAITLIGATLFVLLQYSTVLPQGSVDRIVGFIEQRYDGSSQERVLAGRAAMEEIGKAPLGLGIGGFSRAYNFGSSTDRIYPHNIVLEITVENGWLVGLLFVLIVAIGVVRGYRAANIEPMLRPFFAIFVYAFCNALVSGDINDNKIVYALLCIALIAPELIAKKTTVAGLYYERLPAAV